MAARLTIEGMTKLKPNEAVFVIEFIKDFDARRAATCAGYVPDSGYAVRDRPHVQEAIAYHLQRRLNSSDIDAEWVMMELVDNHLIARQNGNITASNTALGLLCKHKVVDAFAADKIVTTDNKDIMERLLRGRKRLQTLNHAETAEFEPMASEPPVSFF